MSMLIPNVEELVHAEHRYRKLLALLNWTDLAKPLRRLYSDVGRRGYAVEQGLKCLFQRGIFEQVVPCSLSRTAQSLLSSSNGSAGFEPQALGCH